MKSPTGRASIPSPPQLRFWKALKYIGVDMKSRSWREIPQVYL
jgi:hypothetical protein